MQDLSRHQGVPGSFNASGTYHTNRYRLMGPRTNARNAVGSGSALARVSNNSMAPLSMDNLENGIECVLRALSLAPEDDSELSGQLDSLAVSHPNLFALARVGDYESLMKCASSALAFFPKAHPNQPKFLSKLGASHGDRFKRLNELNDLEKAIEYITRALNLAREDDPDQPMRLNDLGEYHGYRFRRLGDLDDLEKAMGHARRAVAMTPDGHSDQAKRLNNLGTLYNHRFEYLGALEDNEKAIKCGTFTLSLTPDDHPDLPKWLNTIGVSHSFRFRHLGGPDDSKMAIDYTSRAVALTPDDHPDLSHRLNNLGESHRDQFQRLGSLVDLEKAVECTHRALTSAPVGHPELPIWLNNLGALHGDRFRRLGELTDCRLAIEYVCRALDSTPGGHPDLPKALNNLGILYGDQFRRLSDLDDLGVAIDYMSRALTLTSNDHPSRPARLNSLGELYGYRFRRLGDLGDLNKAMEHMRRAVESTPGGHPELPLRLNNLGVLHSDRFRRLGAVEDSDDAIKYGADALLSIPAGHPDEPKLLSCLGVSYRDRFKNLNELNDLEWAIEHMYRAMDLTPEDHPEFSHRLSNLSATHHVRFQRRGELNDYARAIEHGSRALNLTPDDHPDKPNRLHDLGELYGAQFRRLCEFEILDEAIEYMSRAVAMTPDGHPDLSNWLSSLGECHGDRFQHLEEIPDLERAVNHADRALVLTPEGHPSFPAKYSLMARLRIFQYNITPTDLYLQDALGLFRMAAKSSAGAPGTKFKIAFEWASLATISDYSPLDCIEAYQTTIDLLPQYVWLGATTNQRYVNLSEAVNLAVNASAAAIRYGKHALALEWMEQARCVVWNQILRLRSPVDELYDVYPDIATRLREVARWLDIAGSRSQESRVHSSGAMTPEEVGREHRRMALEYDGLLAEARRLPGFGDFLRPKKANVLINAARNGPIVAVNCHEAGCDALIILPGNGNISHIPLPNYSEEKACQARREWQNLLRSKGIRGVKHKAKDQNGEFGSTLAALWYDIVKPVLEKLEYMNAPKGNWPHITWCPTGTLSFLPLHAAGDYNLSGSRVFDYVISSYTPTLAVLLTPRPKALGPDSQILAIGQEHTPGHMPLPGASKELADLKSRARDKVRYSQLMNEQATKNAVLDEMEHHDWVHLACHAHQNVNDPTKSGFFLHDDILDLASINRRSFKNKGLAFLSACQTAAGDEGLPDEVIHLASGMLMAGYKSVIATMSSVSDSDAPFVADNVYGLLLQDGRLENGEAGKALHQAVTELRGRVGEKEFSRWVPYIHIGS